MRADRADRRRPHPGEFVKGYIEATPLADAQVDVIVRGHAKARPASGLWFRAAGWRAHPSRLGAVPMPEASRIREYPAYGPVTGYYGQRSMLTATPLVSVW